MTSPAVEVEGLRFTYPDGRRALHGLDLTVERRARVALLGPNGAGKTTLALHLNGIHRPEEGTVRIGGTEVAEPDLAEIRQCVGLVFQDPDDQLFMPTVREDVAFGPANLGVAGRELEETVVGALRAVGAAELIDRAPHHLSDGEKRRVAVATVLAMRPEVLVLDEPTAGLDPAGRRELAGVLRRLEMTQLLITHDLPFALELCPETVLISRGRTVARGPTPEVLADEDLLRTHGLELPFGFDPGVVRASSSS